MICPKCLNLVKPEDRRRGRQVCAPCRRRQANAYKNKHAAALKIKRKAYIAANPTKIRAGKRNWNEANVIKYLITVARCRNARQGNKHEFTITAADLTLPATCPILGIPLRKSRQSKLGPKDDSFSLDRIDSTKGYIPGNVAIISWRANRLKNNGTAAEHARIAVWICTHGLP